MIMGSTPIDVTLASESLSALLINKLLTDCAILGSVIKRPRNKSFLRAISDSMELTLFEMGFCEPSVIGGGGGRGHEGPHHNLVVIAPMITKIGTGIKLDVFYTMVTKNLYVATIM